MGISFFGRKKKQEEQAPPKRSAEITISRIPEWIESTFSADIKSSVRTASSMQKNALKTLSDIGKSAGELENARVEGKERVYSAANMTKDQFAKRIVGLAESASKLKAGSDYASFDSFCTGIESTIKDMSTISPKQGFLLSNYFKKESTPLIERIKKADSEIKEFRRFLDSEGKILFLDYVTKISIHDYMEMVEKSERLRKQKIHIEEEIKSAEKRVSDTKEKLERFLESDEYSMAKEHSKETEKIKNKLDDLKSRINEQIMPLERPMKKLDYLVSKEYVLDKDQVWFLREFIDNPFSIMMSEGSEKFLIGILENIQKLLDEEKIILKGSEYSKVKDLMKKLEKQIPALKKEYAEVQEHLKSMESADVRIKEMEAKEKSLSETMESIRNSVPETIKTRESTENEIEKTERHTNEMKESITSRIEKITGYKITLI